MPCALCCAPAQCREPAPCRVRLHGGLLLAQPLHVVAAEAEPKADSAVVPKGKGGTKGTRAPKALGVKPKAKSGIKRRREEHNDGADEDGAERKRRQWIRQSKFIQQLFGYGDQGKGQKGQRQGHV